MANRIKGITVEFGYLGDYYENEEMASVFWSGLKEVCGYCWNIDLQTIVNGVSAFHPAPEQISASRQLPADSH